VSSPESPNEPSESGEAVICAGAVVRDADGRLLLVRRGRPPAQGSWTLPGGRVEPGESAAEAAVREVREETGLDVEVGELLATLPVLGYLVHDFTATVIGGSLCAGDDADDVGWFDVDELAALELSPGLLDALLGMNVL
jgi:8-oxo-dGTP diphosphatase